MKFLLKLLILFVVISLTGSAFGETIICPPTHKDMPLIAKGMDFSGKIGLCEYSDEKKGTCSLKYLNVRATNPKLWKPAGPSFLKCEDSPENCAFESGDKPSQPVESCSDPRK